MNSYLVIALWGSSGAVTWGGGVCLGRERKVYLAEADGGGVGGGPLAPALALVPRALDTEYSAPTCLLPAPFLPWGVTLVRKGKKLGPRTRALGSQGQFSCSVAVWLWARHTIPLCLSFPISKRGMLSWLAHMLTQRATELLLQVQVLGERQGVGPPRSRWTPQPAAASLLQGEGAPPAIMAITLFTPQGPKGWRGRASWSHAMLPEGPGPSLL